MKIQTFFKYALLVAFAYHSHAQSLQELNTRKEKLVERRKIIDDSITYLTRFISTVQHLEAYSVAKFPSVVKSNTRISKSSIAGDEFLGTLQTGDSIIIYDLNNEQYLIRSKYLIGLIPMATVDQTKAIKKYNKQITKANKSKTRLYTNESYSNTSPNTKSYQSSGSSSYGGTHTIHTGPRGGQYYINKNGNKTYVKKRK